MEEIHVWQLNQDSLFIFLPNSLRDALFIEAQARFKTQKAFFNAIYFGAASRGLVRSVSHGNLFGIARGSRSLPLWGLLELCKMISGAACDDNSVSRVVEKQIAGYKSGEQGTIVYGAFPILVSPEFDSLVGNFLGDGTFGGFGQVASYCQKNEFGRRRFLEKLHFVFGDFALNENAYTNSLQVLVPKPMIEIIRGYYGIIETHCLCRRLPEKIKSAPFENRLAALIAFLIDEGHIGDEIDICIGNKLLLEDFRDLAVSLGYACSEITSRPGHHSPRPSFRFRICMTSAKKLFEDVAVLREKSPLCDLAHKQRLLELIVRRQAIKHLNVPFGATKNKIVELIAEGANTTNALKEILPLSGATLNEHLRDLKEAGRIQVVGKIRDGNVWAVCVEPAPIAVDSMQGDLVEENKTQIGAQTEVKIQTPLAVLS